MIEEKLLKIDELARNIDRISLDVDSLKLRSIPPNHDINESLKAMRISLDECKERIARMRAKKDVDNDIVKLKLFPFLLRLC